MSRHRSSKNCLQCAAILATTCRLTYTLLLVTLTISFFPNQLQAALVIDDFEQGGPFLLSANHSNPTIHHIANGINVLGGVRELEVGSGSLTEDDFVNVELTLTTGDDALVFSGANLPNNGFSAAIIRYGSDLGIDLTQYGDRFYIDLADDQPQTGYSVFLFATTVTSTATLITVNNFRSPILNANGSGHYEIFFDELLSGTLPLDPTDVDAIHLWIISEEVRAFRPPLKIAEIGVVPEPKPIILAMVSFIFVFVIFKKMQGMTLGYEGKVSNH